MEEKNKGWSEAVNLRRTGNTITKSKGTKRQTMVNKIQHRKLMIEEHERYLKRKVNSDSLPIIPKIIRDLTWLKLKYNWDSMSHRFTGGLKWDCAAHVRKSVFKTIRKYLVGHSTK